MALADQLQKFTAKTQDVAGLANVIGNIPGVPTGIKDSINSLFNTGRGLTPGQNRRDLNNFLSNVSRLNGFTRPAHFYVEIAPPPCMLASSSTARDLAFLTESANLPGVSLATSEVKRHGYGVPEKKPYMPIFVDTTFTFLVDGSGEIQKFFYTWMNSIVKFDTSVNGYGAKYGNNIIDPFEVNYKDQYATDILVTTVDDVNNDILNVRFMKAFPIFMGDISLGWNDSDSIARLPITFTYVNWKIENINLQQVAENREPGLVQKLLKAGTALQTLAMLRKPRGIADTINVINNTKLAISKFF